MLRLTNAGSQSIPTRLHLRHCTNFSTEAIDHVKPYATGASGEPQ